MPATAQTTTPPGHFWIRALVLFAGLALIKGALIFSAADQLFTAHWRWLSKSSGWLDQIGYCVFVLLAAGSLVLLGHTAKSMADRRTIRRTAFATAVISFVFTLLMREQFERNYLYTYMLGLLEFAPLGNYLYLDLFFAPPYLAVYVAAFAFAAWFCCRSGRDHWLFHVLAALAFCYFSLNQGAFDVRDGKWMQLSCLAIAGFATWFAHRQGLRPLVMAAPLGLLAIWWIAFAAYSRELSLPHPYFVLLFAIALALLVPLWLSVSRTGLAPVLSSFLPFYFLSFLLLANANFGPARNYDMLFSWAMAAPQYLATEFVIVVLLLAVAGILGRRRPRAACVLFDVAGLALISLALADYLVQRKMGTRIDWNLLTMSDDFTKVWSLVQPHLPLLMISVTGLIAVYLGVIRLLHRLPWSDIAPRNWRWHPHTTFGAASLAALALVALRVSGSDAASHHSLVQIVNSSPMMKRISVERWSGPELIAHARSLQLDPAPVPTPAATGQKTRTNLNVVLVIMESSYNRYLSLFGARDETQPLLARYRERMELFPNYYSLFPNSLHARFSIYNGLYATVEYPSYLNPRIASPSLFELLHDAGYTTELFYSSTRHYTRMNDYLGHRKIDLFHDCDTMPGRERHEKVSWGVSETATLEAMKARIDEHARDPRPFFLSYIPAAPHQPFEKPAREFQKFDDSTAKVDKNYRGAYQNQLLYMDWVIASLIGHLETTGLLDNTVVIITNDHGEMVGEEEGKLGHGWYLKPELCNTPLIVMDPRRPGARINRTFGSHVDILPTLLAMLDVPVPVGELYQGVSLYSEQAQASRPIYLHSYRDRALVQNGEFLWLENYRAGMSEAEAVVRRFLIRNEGAATTFEEAEPAGGILKQHLEFERFQHSLIVHYDYYREQVGRNRLSSGIPADQGRRMVSAQ